MFLPTHPSTLAPFSESVQVCSVESFCSHSWTSWQNVHSLVTWPYTHLSSWCKAISISLACQHWVLCKSLAYSYPENYQAIFKATRAASFFSNKNHPRATAQLFFYFKAVCFLFTVLQRVTAWIHWWYLSVGPLIIFNPVSMKTKTIPGSVYPYVRVCKPRSRVLFPPQGKYST